MNIPVYGCNGCSTSGGVMSCPDHGRFVINVPGAFMLPEPVPATPAIPPDCPKCADYRHNAEQAITTLRARLQTVEGELYELDREYGPIRALLDHEGKNLKKIIEEREQAEQRVAALRKFTSHRGDCSLGKHGHPYEGVCDCGLDAALASATPEGPRRE